MEDKSGLLLPSRFVKEAAPIDYTYKYIPWSVLDGVIVPMEQIIEVLRQFNRDDTIALCANLGSLSHPSSSTGILNELIAKAAPELYERAKTLLEAGDKFFGPQAALTLAKMAIAFGEDDQILPIIPFHVLVGLLLLIQDHFVPLDGEKDSFQLASGLAANYWLHKRLIPAIEYENFKQRWLGTDQTATRLRELYLQSRGVPVETVADISLTLIQIPLPQMFRFNVNRNPADQHQENVLKSILHLSCDAAKFKELFKSTDDFISFSMDFSDFQRFPFYERSDGRFTVLDLSMLIRRTLGWPLVNDALYPATPVLTKSEIKGIVADVQSATEHNFSNQIIEAFGTSWSNRIIEETELRRVFGGVGVKVADIAVEFPNSWLIIEISALRPVYQALAGQSVEHYSQMIEQAVGEARQAISTARQFLLHADNNSLDFKEIGKEIIIYPVALLTEGFPIGPIASSEIRKIVSREEGHLDGRIRPIEIINPDEFRMLLGLSVKFGMSVVDLIEAKARSNFHADSVNNFLCTEFREEIQQL